MQTVNFQCGHCGNLMAVSTEFLGQQVRCPTCQGVVVAPSATEVAPQQSAQADLPQFDIPKGPDPDSIFSPPEETTDDIFGASAAPRLVIPPSEPQLELAPQPAPAPAAAFETTLPDEPSAPAPAETHASESVESAVPSWMSNGPSETAPVAADDRPGDVLVRSPRRSGGAGAVMWIVLISLISYSILATVLVVILYMQRTAAKAPSLPLLEYMPDVDGDNPGAKRTEARMQKRPGYRDYQQRVPIFFPRPPKETNSAG